MEITTKVQEAIKSLQSKGQIVRVDDEFGKGQLYFKTEGRSLETGDKFPIFMPIALTDEFRDLGMYMELERKKKPYLVGRYNSDRALRI
jgi:hypothetical protein